MVRPFTYKEHTLASQLRAEFEALCPQELVCGNGDCGSYRISVRREKGQKHHRLYFENLADGITVSLSFLLIARHFMNESRRHRPFRWYNDDKPPKPYPFKIERHGDKARIVPEAGWFIRDTK